MRTHSMFDLLSRRFAIVAAMAGTIALLAGGCLEPVDDSEAVDELVVTSDIVGSDDSPGEEHTATSDVGSDDSELLCCDSGYFTCPSTGKIYEYDTPGCGPFTRLQASQRCNSACGPQCIDSGWLGC